MQQSVADDFRDKTYLQEQQIRSGLARPEVLTSKKQIPSHPLHKALPPGFQQDKETMEKQTLDPPQAGPPEVGTKNSEREVPKSSSPKQAAEVPEPASPHAQVAKSDNNLGARPKVQKPLKSPTNLRRSLRAKSSPVKYPKWERPTYTVWQVLNPAE